MEGPSLIIAQEDLARFVGKKPEVDGSAAPKLERIAGKKLTGLSSWGKHFLLRFGRETVRIHFLMFGSYRVDDRRADKGPTLSLAFPNGEVNFYTCAAKLLEQPVEELYDWSNDVMSPDFDARAAAAKIRAKPDRMVCDVLMDQEIFAGVGNIIKNEVLYRLALHPETRVDQLTPAKIRKLVAEAVRYSHQFYEWKKVNQLKRNWKIFRRRACADCGAVPIKVKTGVGQRVSFICPNKQNLQNLSN